MKKDSVIRISEVSNITGLRRCTIYKLMNQDSFPRSFKLTNNSAAVGWSLNEIQDWINNVKSKRNN